MFRGELTHNMDSKSRIVLPLSFREVLGQKFVITKGFEECILVYTMAKWEDIEQRASLLSSADPDARRFLRRFIGAATDVTPDLQGRFVIPLSLKEHAHMEPQTEVVSVGLGDRIEIWSKENWIHYNTQECVIDKSMQEKISQVGI
ncbi:MAG: division/cell wall cluster transcriptional repressor MraZ [Defluviitaleaceae bacterium]|nr:division/cell wall cluster transcriptional repressor MraZ [Defluviitaleaceae bacterium]